MRQAKPAMLTEVDMRASMSKKLGGHRAAIVRVAVSSNVLGIGSRACSERPRQSSASSLPQRAEVRHPVVAGDHGLAVDSRCLTMNYGAIEQLRVSLCSTKPKVTKLV